MKLAEFLNDDTCQIFLAIIVGIVICYFIFGSCGTCRDGFSVGGPCVGSGGIPNPGCTLYPDETACEIIPGCEWNAGEDPYQVQLPEYCSDWHDNDPNGGCGVRSNRKPDYFTRDCRNSPSGNCDSTYCCINPSPPTLSPTPPPNSGQTQMERDCEAYLATLSSDAGSPCEGVTLGEEGGLDSTPSCCDAVESTGGCNKDTLPDEITTRINQEIALCSNPSTDPRQSPPTGNSPPPTANSPPPPPTSENKYEHILSNMASAVLDIAESALAVSSSTDDKDFLEGMMTNPVPDKDNFQRVKSIAESNSIYFQILINKSGNRNFIVNDGLKFCYPNSNFVGNARDNQLVDFGNLFKTFSKAPLEVKKDLYCGKNSMLVNYGNDYFEKYDPLLKMKSPSIMMGEYVNCGGENTIFPSSCPYIGPQRNDILKKKCDFYIRPSQEDGPGNSINEYNPRDGPKNEFDRMITLRGGSDESIEFVKNNYDTYSDKNYGLGRNHYELIIRDDSNSDDDSKFINTNLFTFTPSPGQYTQLYFRGSNAVDGSIDSSGLDVLDFQLGDGSEMGRGYFKLNKVYGMSQNSHGNIYNTNEGRGTPSDNKYNYYMNLLFIQYLITKIYLGTENYLPFNLNIYNKQPPDDLLNDNPQNREDIPPITGSKQNDVNNQLCAASGNDYLLLVYTNPVTEINYTSTNYYRDWNRQCPLTNEICNQHNAILYDGEDNCHCFCPYGSFLKHGIKNNNPENICSDPCKERVGLKEIEEIAFGQSSCENIVLDEFPGSRSCSDFYDKDGNQCVDEYTLFSGDCKGSNTTVPNSQRCGTIY